MCESFPEEMHSTGAFSRRRKRRERGGERRGGREERGGNFNLSNFKSESHIACQPREEKRTTGCLGHTPGPQTPGPGLADLGR